MLPRSGYKALAAFGSGLTVTHASFYYFGKRNLGEKETKESVVKETKDGLTLSFIPVAVAGFTWYLENPVLAVMVAPSITHGVAYEYGKYKAACEKQENEKGRHSRKSY
jgi:hypothetical protein